MRTSHLKLVSLAAFAAAAFAASGDWASFRFENDCLRMHADNDYTHGTELDYCWDDLWYFKLQQNMYAPDDLRRPDHIVGDRPYCGWLGAEVGREMFAGAASPWTHYLGVNFGMIGPSAHAGEVQKWVHGMLGCRNPEGWDNQLHDEFCINFQWWTKYNWYVTDWFAVIPRAGVLAGTIQDAAEVGCDFKIGWNLRNDVGNRIMFSASRDGAGGSFWDRCSVYVYTGPDCRYYLYNHVLEGSLFNSKDDDLGVDTYPFVGEIQAGVGIEAYGFFMRYYAIFRTKEFKGQDRPPDYGGLVFGYRW